MKFKNSGSIRDDFSSGSEEEDNRKSPYIEKEINPGPGNYLKHFHTN